MEILFESKTQPTSMFEACAKKVMSMASISKRLSEKESSRL